MPDSVILGLSIRPGSFSDRWVELCRELGIPFREMDPFLPDFIQQALGLNAFAWHWSHDDAKAALMARQVTMALEAMGVEVFPNTATSWHYDDKVGQKYLLEAIGASVPESWVFYDLQAALSWVEGAVFPKVFKLRCGAGSSNVRLVKSRQEAEALCRKAFKKGFASSGGYFSDAKTKVRKVQSWAAFVGKLRRAPSAFLKAVRTSSELARSRGYIFFQEFLPGNAHDTRITVIGDRAFGFIRRNRPGDFRASGSGALDHATDLVSLECVRSAFDVAKKLGTQSLAFDFLWDENKRPMIVEISYCYQAEAVYKCPGHWDSCMNWHEGHLWPQDAILNDLLGGILK